MPLDDEDDDFEDDDRSRTDDETDKRAEAFMALSDALDSTGFATEFIELLSSEIIARQQDTPLTLLFSCDDPGAPVHRFMWGNADLREPVSQSDQKAIHAELSDFSEQELATIKHIRACFTDAESRAQALRYAETLFDRNRFVNVDRLLEFITLSSLITEEGKAEMLNVVFKHMNIGEDAETEEDPPTSRD